MAEVKARRATGKMMRDWLHNFARHETSHKERPFLLRLIREWDNIENARNTPGRKP